MSFSERTLRGILAENTPTAADMSITGARAEEFAQVLLGWSPAIVKIFLSGSLVKGTTVRGGADVDLFVSLSSRTTGTLNQLSEGLFQWLHYEKRYIVERQNVSSRVHFGALKIDVVPGKRQSQNGNDHSLWSRALSSHIKTNIMKQLRHVADSGRQEEIQLAKIWRNMHGLTCPSFLLELAVIDALYGRWRDRLAENFELVLAFLAGPFIRARLTDPGNGANVVSSSLSFEGKLAIAEAARRSLGASSTPAAFRK